MQIREENGLFINYTVDKLTHAIKVDHLRVASVMKCCLCSWQFWLWVTYPSLERRGQLPKNGVPRV